jgi:HEAT repeat protein
VLASALRDESTEVADSAAIALARTVTTPEVGPIVPLLTRNLSHPERTPREAAVLGLGILGGPVAGEQLRLIALDLPAGRELCGSSGPLDEMFRGLAALGLGLVDSPEAVAPLATLASTPTTSRELAAAAVVALGLQRNGAPAAVVALARLLDDRALDREVRAQVPTALARLPASCSRGMLPRMLELLSDRRTSNELGRSLALAVGHVATLDDADAVRALTEAARRNDDASTRQFSLLALGRILETGARTDAAGAKLRSSTLGFLGDQVQRPTQRSLRPWAALALGIAARGDPTSGTAAPSADLALAARRLIEVFESESDPSVQGALALALGLARAPSAPAVLRTRLQQTAHPGLRGHLALALGLLKDAGSIEALRQLLADPSLPPTSRVDVARGLALTGDAGFEKRLLDLMAQADDVPSAVAYAKALGLVGGQGSADALRRMAEDPALPELQRGFAVVAIGLLAEKTPLPWNVPFLIDANYTVPLRPLEEVLDLL